MPSNRRLTDLTLGEVYALQQAYVINAVGKYQVIRGTMGDWITAKSPNLNQYFSIELQDTIGDWLFLGKPGRKDLNEYLTGKVPNTQETLNSAINDLAKEFASVPVAFDQVVTNRDGTTRFVRRGTSYYSGIADNASTISLSQIENSLKISRSTYAASRSIADIKRVVGDKEGGPGVLGYDAINRGVAGDTRTPPIGSTDTTTYADYFGALSSPPQTIPSLAGVVPTQALDDYFNRVYKNQIVTRIPRFNRSTLAPIEIFDAINSPNRDEELSLEERVGNSIISGKIVTGERQLRGELEILGFLGEKLNVTNEEIKNIVGTVSSFSRSGQRLIVKNGLIEFFPDRMREKMVQNSTTGGENPNYSHAWRSPGKLAITADITIPGISGFRIGQIFWIDRTYENYKQFGAFQLFGLTETINREGWKTSIYSRFNALTKRSVSKLIQSHDGLSLIDSP